MTSKEFVLWLQGFTQGVHEHNITPKQWDALKGVLSKVNDEPTPSLPLGVPNNGTIPGTGYITTTPGGGSITFNPSTSTTYGYPSGSAWCYTVTRTEPTPPTSEKQLLTENHD
jgi:hypothetical protein